MSDFLGFEIKTPWGPMATLVDVTKAPVVIGASFSDIPTLIKKSNGKIPVVSYTKDSKLAGVTNVVNDWLDGKVNAFDSLKVRQPGGEFTLECWKALRKVRGGTVWTYSELAAAAGRPRAVRAAGTACATNLIAPIIPCHRIVKTGGELGNYGFGVELKHKILEFEGVEF